MNYDIQKDSTRSLVFDDVRQTTLTLIEGLSDADTTVQSMEDASPAKWHLAHTTWFFETFILRRFAKNYRPFNKAYAYLFNSYYEAEGARHPRPERGMLTRPSLSEVIAYRTYVDYEMNDLLEQNSDQDFLELVALGLHHEQQHQELLLTDLLHLFSKNPLKPAYRTTRPEPIYLKRDDSAKWLTFEGGLNDIGFDGQGFAFDCEGPCHPHYQPPFKICDQLVTNEEWLAFMEDGGYETPTLWLSDGWATVQEQGWKAPLYWQKQDGAWWAMTLRGFQPVDPHAPVCHISYFEADAFARFSGKRLPREQEWELAAREKPISGNLMESGRLRPAPSKGDGQFYGDVWEWTQSPYSPYPGFKAASGAVGEYNGKFMNGQYVLRGGSCVTPPGHIRATYRNFFYPDKRWQFSGLRLAEDL